jgi:hypothetical protein
VFIVPSNPFQSPDSYFPQFCSPIHNSIYAFSQVFLKQLHNASKLLHYVKHCMQCYRL